MNPLNSSDALKLKGELSKGGEESSAPIIIKSLFDIPGNSKYKNA